MNSTSVKKSATLTNCLIGFYKGIIIVLMSVSMTTHYRMLAWGVPRINITYIIIIINSNRVIIINQRPISVLLKAECFNCNLSLEWHIDILTYWWNHENIWLVSLTTSLPLALLWIPFLWFSKEISEFLYSMYVKLKIMSDAVIQQKSPIRSQF